MLPDEKAVAYRIVCARKKGGGQTCQVHVPIAAEADGA